MNPAPEFCTSYPRVLPTALKLNCPTFARYTLCCDTNPLLNVVFDILPLPKVKELPVKGVMVAVHVSPTTHVFQNCTIDCWPLAVRAYMLAENVCAPAAPPSEAATTVIGGHV
jgi:hypothetical protein